MAPRGHLSFSDLSFRGAFALDRGGLRAECGGCGRQGGGRAGDTGRVALGNAADVTHAVRDAGADAGVLAGAVEGEPGDEARRDGQDALELQFVRRNHEFVAGHAEYLSGVLRGVRAGHVGGTGCGVSMMYAWAVGAQVLNDLAVQVQASAVRATRGDDGRLPGRVGCGV